MKKMKKKLLLIALAIGFISGANYRSDFFEIAKQLEIFTVMFKELNMNYVDETNPGDLMDTAIKNMLNELDPYTVFMNEQDVEAARINQTGDFTGIGASVKTLKDKLVIVEPFKDYAADKAGLKAGDEIIEIDNTEVSGFQDNAGDLLRGAAGSKLTIKYLRQGKTYITELKRESVERNAVPLHQMISDNIGYIALSKFTPTAASEVKMALRELKTDGAESLVLDLRGNPGGLLVEAIKIVNLFVSKNQLVVTTKSKVEKYNKAYATQQEPEDVNIPLVVLIDGGSASASEIVSGSLQDLDRAVVIGSRSFGKGLVQRPKKLNYGTQLKVTISRYYTPSGRCIQALDYWNKDKNGKAVRVKQNNYTEFKTKNGRSVFDGGGIKPDIEMNSSVVSPITKAILKGTYVFDFATDYYYNNDVNSPETFKLSDSDFSAFKSYLKKQNFDFKTNTEKALENVFQTANEENLDDAISKQYKTLLTELNLYKNKAIDENKSQLMQVLTDEILKRYFYKEGLYKHFIANNPELLKSKDILSNKLAYKRILNL